MHIDPRTALWYAPINMDQSRSIWYPMQWNGVVGVYCSYDDDDETATLRDDITWELDRRCSFRQGQF